MPELPTSKIQSDEKDITITCCNNLPLTFRWDLNVNLSSSYDTLDDTTSYNESAKHNFERTIQLLKKHNKDNIFLEKLWRGWVSAQTTNRYKDLKKNTEEENIEQILIKDPMWKSQPTSMVVSLVAFFIEKLTNRMSNKVKRINTSSFIELKFVELYEYILRNSDFKDIEDDKQVLKQIIQEYNPLTTPIQVNDSPVTTKVTPKVTPKEHAIKTTSEFEEIIMSLKELTDYLKRNLRKAEVKVQSIDKQCKEAETAKKNAQAVEEEFDREFKSAARFDIGKSPSIKQKLHPRRVKIKSLNTLRF
jgi:hypothetical protein